MQFLLMIYGQESQRGAMSEADRGKMMSEYGAFTKGIQESKNYVNGNAIQPTSTATTVTVRDGRVSKKPGPFAETKEQLGGYYLVNAKDVDEACAIAAKIPGARDGSIEVRPIIEM